MYKKITFILVILILFIQLVFLNPLKKENKELEKLEALPDYNITEVAEEKSKEVDEGLILNAFSNRDIKSLRFSNGEYEIILSEDINNIISSFNRLSKLGRVKINSLYYAKEGSVYSISFIIT